MPKYGKKYYITTPIYYVNDIPHIGHAYTTIMADILARYHRMLGEDVFFLGGTDENAQKNIEAAEREMGKKGLTKKEVQKYVDKMSALWQITWDEIGIAFDGFIRTTEKRHRAAVKKFFEAVCSKGDIYLGEYKGLYCKGCEAYVTESDLEKGKCPLHKTKPEMLKEKNYFFKLSAYRKKLLSHIKKNPKFIQPQSRRNEIERYIKDFMEDISISREKAKWGIPVPQIGNKKTKKQKNKMQVLYVWFDALINYLTGIGYAADEEKFLRYWPADLHLMAKDIIKFHGALWPAMLISAGLPLPRKIFAHGFFTIDGQKISKTLGNVIDPLEVARKYGIDTLRYYLAREVPFGEDGDFSYQRLEKRYESDLANGLGNLASRVLGMALKYFDGKTPQKTLGSAAPTWQSYKINMDEMVLHQALTDIWDLIAWCDKFIDQEQPWVLVKIDKEQLSRVIYTLLETLRHIAWMLWPFMPAAAEGIWSRLGILEQEKKKSFDKAKEWGGLVPGTKINKGASLFPRL